MSNGEVNLECETLVQCPDCDGRGCGNCDGLGEIFKCQGARCECRAQLDVTVTLDIPPMSKPTLTMVHNHPPHGLHKHVWISESEGTGPALAIGAEIPNEILVGRDLYGLPAPGTPEWSAMLDADPSLRVLGSGG